MILMFLNGLFSPVWSAVFGGIWVTGRLIYGYGYAKYGPNARKFG